MDVWSVGWVQNFGKYGLNWYVSYKIFNANADSIDGSTDFEDIGMIFTDLHYEYARSLLGK